MIDPKVVRRFLKRHLDSHVWMKELTDADLDRELAALDPPPRFRTPPMRHQKVGFLLAMAYEHFYYGYDMGTGKTWLALNILDYLIWSGRIKRALCLMPTYEVMDTWEEQIEKHTPNLAYVCLRGSIADKREELGHLNRGLILSTYQGVTLLVSEKQKKEEGKGNRLKPTRKAVLNLAEDIGALIMDEATSVSSWKSLWYRICNQISKRSTYHYAFAGRMFGRDPIKMWSQFHLVDRGETLGSTLGLFRQAFYKEKKGYWSRYEYTFDKTKEKTLSKMIGHRSLAYIADECMDLPKIIYIPRLVSFPEDTEAYYQRIVREVIGARGNLRAMKNAFMRMRQVSSGFLGFKDDETGEKAQIEFEHNPKLAMTMQMLDEVPDRSKTVIFHEFIWSGKRIAKELTKRKIPFAAINGQTEDSKKEKHRFRTDKRCRVLVLNTRIGAYGMDGLQDVSWHMLFFESPVPVIDREQAERRLRRKGQEHKVIVGDPMVRGSADERIREYHKEGQDLHAALVEDPARIVKR